MCTCVEYVDVRNAPFQQPLRPRASSPRVSWVETRPGRTMDSPGPAAGTRSGGPKAPERLTAGSAGCCCCGCSWSKASRKEVASAAGCRLERSASPDRMNARFGRALLYSTIRARRDRSGPVPAARGYDPVRQSVRYGRRGRRRPAGLPGVRHRCRAAHRGLTALSDLGVRRHHGHLGRTGLDCRAHREAVRAGRLLPERLPGRL
jgi:hypothetical protein